MEDGWVFISRYAGYFYISFRSLSFFLYLRRLCMWSCFSRVWLFATMWTVAHQALLSMGFSRQEYWSGLPCPPSGDLPNPGVKLESALAGRFFTTSTTWDAPWEAKLHECHQWVPCILASSWIQSIGSSGQKTGWRKMTEISVLISQFPSVGVAWAPLLWLKATAPMLSRKASVTTTSLSPFRCKAVTSLKLLTYPLPTIFKS